MVYHASTDHRFRHMHGSTLAPATRSDDLSGHSQIHLDWLLGIWEGSELDCLCALCVLIPFLVQSLPEAVGWERGRKGNE